MLKFKIADPELEGGTREIYEEIQAIKAKKGAKVGKDVEGKDAEDEDWATDSEEEDVDADDDDEEMKD